MPPSLVHLPNGQTITVSPVFAGLSFKANDLNLHHSIFPPGWTIILESEDDEYHESSLETESDDQIDTPRRRRVRRFKTPTLHNDSLFISSISNPSNTDFKPATSPTRQIAMMLWATLLWYFHQVPRMAGSSVWTMLTWSQRLRQTHISPRPLVPKRRSKASQKVIGGSTLEEKAYSRGNTSSRSWSAWDSLAVKTPVSGWHPTTEMDVDGPKCSSVSVRSGKLILEYFCSHFHQP